MRRGRRHAEPQDSIFEPSAAQRDEYKAMEDSVRGYVDERLEQVGTPSGLSKGNFYQRWRVEIWALPILLLLAFNTFRDHITTTWLGADRPVEKRKGEERPSKKETQAEARDSRMRVDLAAIQDKPLQAWTDFVEAHPEPVVALMRKLADGEDLPANRVSSSQRERFTDFADAIESDQSLATTSLADIRTGLFEYTMKLWQLENGKTVDEDVDLIDLSVAEAEYPLEHLTGVLETLGLAASFSDRTVKQSDLDLRTAIVMTWIAQGR